MNIDKSKSPQPPSPYKGKRTDDSRGKSPAKASPPKLTTKGQVASATKNPVFRERQKEVRHDFFQSPLSAKQAKHLQKTGELPQTKQQQAVYLGISPEEYAFIQSYEESITQSQKVIEKVVDNLDEDNMDISFDELYALQGGNQEVESQEGHQEVEIDHLELQGRNQEIEPQEGNQEVEMDHLEFRGGNEEIESQEGNQEVEMDQDISEQEHDRQAAFDEGRAEANKQIQALTKDLAFVLQERSEIIKMLHGLRARNNANSKTNQAKIAELEQKIQQLSTASKAQAKDLLDRLTNAVLELELARTEILDFKTQLTQAEAKVRELQNEEGANKTDLAQAKSLVVTLKQELQSARDEARDEIEKMRQAANRAYALGKAKGKEEGEVEGKKRGRAEVEEEIIATTKKRKIYSAIGGTTAGLVTMGSSTANTMVQDFTRNMLAEYGPSITTETTKTILGVAPLAAAIGSAVVIGYAAHHLYNWSVSDLTNQK